MRRHFSLSANLVALATAVFSFVLNGIAQAPETGAPETSGWWYTGIVAITILGIAVAVFFWIKSKASNSQPPFNYEARYRNNYNKESYDTEGVDAAKEMEWLRKMKKGNAKSATSPARKNGAPTVKATTGDNGSA